MEENFLFALSLTIIAWLATWIWSFLIFFTKKFNPKILALSLGFSAWVMIYVSFMEILPKAIEELWNIFPDKEANIWWTILFFVWIFIIAIIDKFVPNYENPHEIKNIKALENENKIDQKKLLRMGIFSAIAISIHNFPEWLATFVSAMKNPEIWISIATAIAIHNIPEWIAVAVPIYYATKNKLKAGLLGLGSWIVEILWALVWYFLIISFFPEINFWYIFAIVAWIMVYISLDELLPTAEEYWEHHIAIWWLIAWMMVMALSLVLL